MSASTSGEQVANNELILEHIASHIKHPANRCRTRLVSKKFNKVITNYYNEWTTLTFTKIDNSTITDVEVKYGQSRWILSNVYIKPDEIVAVLPEDAYLSIKKIVVRGVRCEATRDFQNHMIKIDEDFGYFLNRFPSLKHLEFESVFLSDSFFNKSAEWSFITKVEHFYLLDLSYFNANELQSLVNLKKLKNLYVSEKMLRPEEDLLKSLENSSINVAVYLDEKLWPDWEMPMKAISEVIEQNGQMIESTRLTEIDRDWYIRQVNKFHLVPYHKIFKREIDLDKEKLPKIKQCEDLVELWLYRSNEEVNDAAIGNLILEIQYLQKLDKLVLDGYFTTDHLRKLTSVMEDCPKLVNLTIIMRPHTTNENDYVVFIRNIPERIFYLELNNIVSDEAIIALNDQKSSSLLHLEWVYREVEPSAEALRMVFEDRAMFQKLRGIILDNKRGIQYITRSLRY